MKNIRRLALMVSLCLLTVLSLGIVLFAASACQPAEQSETLDGTYYADVNGEEYTVAFSSGDSYAFTFSVAGDDRTGTYFYSGSAVTLTFSEEGETLSATLSGDVLSFTYKGTAYEMIPMVTYTVTFDLDGGTGTASAQVVNGRLLPKPADPQKDGNVFIGWYADSAFAEKFDFETQKITGNVTLYARFVEGPAAEEFTVSFETGSGYEGDPIADVQTIGHHLYELPELPALDGKDFLGWWRSDYEDAAKLTAMVTEEYEYVQNTTLFAVWESDAPAVSVTESGVSWTSVGVNASYTVTIAGPDEVYVDGEISTALSMAFDFGGKPAGEYVVTVAAKGETATAYYINKALDKVSLFSVEDSTLLFNSVENAEYYLLTYTCGTVGHKHTNVRLDTPSYDFSDCDMVEGGFSFVVQACADGYVTSVSEPFVFERHLDAVTGLKVDETKDIAVWDAVSGAESYIVEVKEGTETERFVVSETKFDLQYYYGELTISVTPTAHGYNSPVAAVENYSKARLATPENIRTDGATVVWDPVDGATGGYVVVIAGEEYPAEQESFALSGAELGDQTEFTVSVYAVAADSANNSFASPEVILSTKLVEITYENGVVSWNPVIGASGYGIRINGGEEIPVDDVSCPVTLTQAGENTIEVCYYLDGTPSAWIVEKVDANVTVTLNGNTGTGSTNTLLYYASGDSVLLPDQTRIGYTFNGWFTAPENGKKVESGVTATESVTYYVHWTANTYTVTLTVSENEGYIETADGTKVQTVEIDVTYDQPFTFNVPLSADGTKAFYGWHAEFGGAGTQYTDYDGKSVGVWHTASDVSVYPSWVEAFSYNLIAHPEKPSENAYSVSKGPGIGYLREVTVPAIYNGLPVTTIEGSCFAGCTQLETVNIPDSIVTVYVGVDGANSTGSAFYNCRSLKAIKMYDASASFEGVNYEKYYTAGSGLLIRLNKGNPELAYVPMGLDGEITIPDGVRIIPLNTFAGTRVKVVNVPSSVVTIGEHAFNRPNTSGTYFINYIEEVNFLPVPEGETPEPLTIGKEAFYNTDIVEITLPARLSEFDISIFTNCYDLEKVHFEVDEDNPGRYTSDDGIVFTDDGATLYFCPIGRTEPYKVPAGVTTIGERAFYDSNITGITIPGNVRVIGVEAFARCSALISLVFEGGARDPALTIEESAFYNCSSLSSVSLPANLKNLGQYAFGGISALTKVTVNAAESIGELNYSTGAFSSTDGVSYVRTLVIGPDVSDFDINGVFGSVNLTTVEVDPANKNFSEQDGVLFNRDITRIVYYPNGKIGDYTLPDTVVEIGAGVFSGKGNLSKITIGSNIKTIAEGAFMESSITEVVFSKEASDTSLTIGKRAFYDCDELTAVDLPARTVSIGGEAFANCSALTSFTVPEGVTSVGNAAFALNSRLTSVSLPSTLESIGMYDSAYDYYIPNAKQAAVDGIDNIDIFDSCWYLAEITIPENNAHFTVIDGVLYGKDENGTAVTLYLSPQGNGGTDGTVTVPSTVTEVKDRAFYCGSYTQAGSVKNVVFSDLVGESLTLGQEIFTGMTSLESVVLPAGLTSIPERMFSETSLQSVFIPNTVTEIGQAAFYRCEQLVDVMFEEDGVAPLVLEDGEMSQYSGGSYTSYTYYGVFAGCSSLKEIELPERTTVVGNYAFSKAAESQGSDTSVTGTMTLEKVWLPSTLTRIGIHAFDDAQQLSSVTFASGGTGNLEIGEYAFRDTGLVQLVLPDGPAEITIAQYAFSGCTLLESIYLSAGVTEIGSFAFGSQYSSFRSSLTTVTLAENSKLADIATYAFANNTSLESANLEASNALTSIGDYAFLNTGLLSVQIPATVKTIGISAFSGCTQLAEIEFLTKEVSGGGGLMQSNLTSVGDTAFAYTDISYIEFPESSEKIKLGDYLFQACNNLTGVYLSTSVVDIGQALTKCMTIETIGVAPGNQNFKGHETLPLLLNTSGTTIVLAYGPVTEEGDGGEYAIPEGFTSIGPGAFYGQNGIKKLTIPASVTEIGDNAFRYCRLLETVEFAQGSVLTTLGDYAFSYCFSLESISLPDSLKNAGEYALAYNSSVTSVYLPAITYSDEYTAKDLLAYNTSLVDLTFSNDLTWLPADMLYGSSALEEVTLPAALGTGEETYKSNGPFYRPFYSSGVKKVNLNGVKVIPDYLFYASSGSTKLEDVDLSGVTEIGNNAFYGCALLKSVDLSSVIEIGNNAFQGCALFEEADLSAATSIGNSAFNGAASLKRITLNNELTSLGNSAFNNCSSLATIDVYDASGTKTTHNEAGVATLPDALTSIGSSCFKNTAFREITIPRGITKLPTSATGYKSSGEVFSGNRQLEKVVLHDAFTLLGSKTFTGCTNLKTVQYYDIEGELYGEENVVTLPESITIIGSYAFGSARGTGTFDEEDDIPCGIEKVIVPSSVTVIGQYAFQDCLSLTYVEYRSAATKYNATTGRATYLFDGCTALERIVLNDAITDLGDNAFRNCSSLATIDLFDQDTGEITENEAGVATLPTSLTYIGDKCFMNTAIREITIPETLTYLGDTTDATSSTAVFSDCTALEKVILHDKLLLIGGDTFLNCKNLKTIQYYDAEGTLVGKEGTVTLPEGIQIVGESAFEQSGVERVILPSSLTMVGKYLFRGCTSLAYAEYLTSSYKYSSTATSTYIFDGCTALETVVLADTLTQLPTYMFNNCSSLKTIRTRTGTGDQAVINGSEGEALLPSGLQALPNYAFYGCSSLTTVLLPEELIEIGSNVFNGCSQLAVIELPASLTEIGSGAFNGAWALTELVLPEGLLTIGSDAFLNTGITQMELPASVTSVGNNAFCKIAVTVADGNKNYFSQENALITAGGVIMSTPESLEGEYVVPEAAKLGAYALNGSALTKVTLSTDQITANCFAYFTGDVVVTLGKSTELPADAFYKYAGTSVTLPEGLTAVGDYAFQECSALTEVVFPETVRSFGKNVFYDNTAIKYVTFPETVDSFGARMFRGCTSLVSVVIPEGVTALGGDTFHSNESLVSVTLPSTLTELGNYEFYYCSSLVSVTLPASLETFGNYLFEGCSSLEEVTFLSLTDDSLSFRSSNAPFNEGLTSLKKITLGDGVTYIPNYMFYGAEGAEIVFSENCKIKGIGEYAFRDTAISSIDLSECTEIGKYAFVNCTFTSFVVPYGITSLGTYVFQNCTALETVWLPDTLTELSKYLFDGCTSLQTVYTYSMDESGEMVLRNEIEEGTADLSCITNIPNYSFQNTAIKQVIFSDELTTIGTDAFLGSALTSVTVPGSVATVDTHAFENCVSLETVVIEEGVTIIDTSAFAGCTALQEISLPDTLLTIETNAFNGCTSLKEITIPANVTKLNVSVFNGWTSAQKVIIELYALDSVSAWTNSWQTGCDAVIEYVIRYSYDEEQSVA
mgnify:FL=1